MARRLRELKDGKGKELIEGGKLFIKRMKTLLNGINLIEKYSLSQNRIPINYERLINYVLNPRRDYQYPFIHTKVNFKQTLSKFTS